MNLQGKNPMSVVIHKMVLEGTSRRVSLYLIPKSSSVMSCLVLENDQKVMVLVLPVEMIPALLLMTT
jgi:hypothetical protein